MRLSELHKKAQTIKKIRLERKITRLFDRANNIFNSKHTQHNRQTSYRELTPGEKKQRVHRVLRERTR